MRIETPGAPDILAEWTVAEPDEFTIDGITAAWVLRITMGPDHPHQGDILAITAIGATPAGEIMTFCLIPQSGPFRSWTSSPAVLMADILGGVVRIIKAQMPGAMAEHARQQCEKRVADLSAHPLRVIGWYQHLASSVPEMELAGPPASATPEPHQQAATPAQSQ